MQFRGLSAFGAGAREMCAQTKLTFHVIGGLFADLFSFNGEAGESVKRLSGPVGIVAF